MSDVIDLNNVDDDLVSTEVPDFQIQTIDAEISDTIELGDDIRAMFYGESGAGKTPLLGTLIDDPRTTPTLMIDLEGGLKSIKSKVRLVNGLKDLGKPVPGKIDVWRIRDFSEIQQVYDFLFTSRYRDKKLVYKALAMDSLTEINSLCTNHVLGKSSSLKIDQKQAKFDEFRKVNSMMKDMIRAFRDIEGMHVFYTALPQLKPENPKDENSRVWIKPALVGQLADQAVALVDYVGYLKIGPGGKRILQFHKDPMAFAKERAEKGKLIKVIEGASADDYITMTRVLNAMLK